MALARGAAAAAAAPDAGGPALAPRCGQAGGAATGAVVCAAAAAGRGGGGARRPWQGSELDSTTPEADKFTVCSYNILSDKLLLASKYLYSKRDQGALPWGVRGPKIVDMLVQTGADIVLLQEVESDTFRSLLVPELGKAGFDGRCESRKGKTDGCALFWRRSKFCVQSMERVDLSSDDGPVLTWGNVAITAVFREVAPTGRLVCVTNTHLVFNEKRGEIKLAQAAILTHAVNAAIEKAGGTVAAVPVVLGGDFNSTPRSKILQFLECGRLRYDNLDRREISGQLPPGSGKQGGVGYIIGRHFVPPAELPKAVCASLETVAAKRGVAVVAAHPDAGQVKGKRGGKGKKSRSEGGAVPEVLVEHHITHPLRLLSAYDGRGVTTFQDRFADTVDHLMYSDHLLSATAIAKLVDYRQLVRTRCRVPPNRRTLLPLACPPPSATRRLAGC